MAGGNRLTWAMFVSFLCFPSCSAAGSCWTWLSGSSAYYGAASYPVSKGSSTNSSATPGSRQGHSLWAAPGRKTVYLFGGHGLAAGTLSDTPSRLNDLWLFSTDAAGWAWLSGQSTLNAPGVYHSGAGVQPEPGARVDAASWLAAGGSALWLFGGQRDATNSYGDLWRFDVATSIWVFVGGRVGPVAVGAAAVNHAAWPAKNVPSNANSSYPLPRYSAATWVDSRGDLWLFGGTSGAFVFADLWRFHPQAPFEWTFVSGSPGANFPGDYPSGVPPSRSSAGSWSDPADNLYLFAGFVYLNASGSLTANDLWLYSNGTWTALTGPTGSQVDTVIGTLGVAAARNQPEIRAEPAVWAGGDGRTVFVLGGRVPDRDYALRFATFNDLWSYDTQLRMWTWLDGDTDGSVNAVGTYGSRGVAHLDNQPSGRTGSRAASAGGSAFLFGGLGVGGVRNPLRDLELGLENDLWLYAACPAAPPPTDPAAAATTENNSAAIIGGAVGGGVGGLIIIVVLVIGLLLFRQRRNAHQQQLHDQLAELGLANGLEFGDWAIPYTDLVLGNELGRGAFGVVYKAVWRSAPCVVKQVQADPLGADHEAKRDFLKEAHRMRTLRPHPNCVQLLGICCDPAHPIAIVTEFVDSGSLESLIKDLDQPIDVLMATEICADVAGGMSHLHEENVLHSDLAARNILLHATIQRDGSRRFQAKVADFGLSHGLTASDVYKAAETAKFPIRWSPVEVLKSRDFSKAADVWSFGVVMYEVFERRLPYFNMTNAEVVENVLRGYRLPQPKTVPMADELYALMLETFRDNPKTRPTFGDIHARLFEAVQRMRGRLSHAPSQSAIYESSTLSDHQGDGSGSTTPNGSTASVYGRSASGSGKPRKKRRAQTVAEKKVAAPELPDPSPSSAGGASTAYSLYNDGNSLGSDGAAEASHQPHIAQQQPQRAIAQLDVDDDREDDDDDDGSSSSGSNASDSDSGTETDTLSGSEAAARAAPTTLAPPAASMDTYTLTPQIVSPRANDTSNSPSAPAAAAAGKRTGVRKPHRSTSSTSGGGGDKPRTTMQQRESAYSNMLLTPPPPAVAAQPPKSPGASVRQTTKPPRRESEYGNMPTRSRSATNSSTGASGSGGNTSSDEDVFLSRADGSGRAAVANENVYGLSPRSPSDKKRRAAAAREQAALAEPAYGKTPAATDD